MTRLASGRDSHLERDEIAVEALRQFDAGSDLSIRKLAAALKVSPAAIYHHFESRDAIVQAAVGLVWEEAFADFLGGGGGDDSSGPPADPVEFLVAGALATRRAFLRHYRVATYISARPEPDSRLAGGLSIFGTLFERLGLHGERAGEALFAYAVYSLGSVLWAASRRLADEGASGPGPAFSSIDARPVDAPVPAPATAAAIDHAVALSDTEREEAYFVVGLRALIAGLVANASGTAESERDVVTTDR